MLKHLSSTAQKYVNNAKGHLGMEEVRSPKRHRRSSTGDTTFDNYMFENNVGHRINPDQKFAQEVTANVVASEHLSRAPERAPGAASRSGSEKDWIDIHSFSSDL